MSDHETIQVNPYFAEGERYPNFIGVKVGDDEYETAYVKKSDMVNAVAYWQRMYEETIGAR